MKTISKLLRRMSVLLVLILMQRAPGYSALYVFGDTVSTTTSNSPAANYYYGNRFCNGRVWVEVLAQWQGLTYDSAKNKSFYGHDSVALTNAALSTSVNSFVPPSNVASALFIVWCNDADFVFMAYNYNVPYNTNSQDWSVKMSQSIDRHKTAINTLYTKGARTIIMPKAVNIAATPSFSNIGAANQLFIKARTTEYNLTFESAMQTLAATKPGLTIYCPDTSALFDQALATPSAFGLTNSTSYALSIPANRVAVSSTSPGASFLFWDDTNPSAKFQMYLADLAQKMISPPKVTALTRSGNLSHLTVANVPLGRQGIVEGSATLQPPWTQDSTFTQPFTAGGSTTKTVDLTSTAPSRFYRVSFPIVWTWP